MTTPKGIPARISAFGFFNSLFAWSDTLQSILVVLPVITFLLVVLPAVFTLVVSPAVFLLVVSPAVFFPRGFA